MLGCSICGNMFESFILVGGDSIDTASNCVGSVISLSSAEIGFCLHSDSDFLFFLLKFVWLLFGFY
ncbi:hypothetical protein BpHYR1_012107 [Brachionus plicatilis]|uniref:Uncharacterized protein n=1 Tax=Brachionus plicatilis TaxID=10195 RepID=A0A3M7R3P9_BRAPC|nr:hypothetical protein BpHYR1_012107 [Brachionus plicatilis]